MKNYLIDTHVLLWYLFEPNKLSKEVSNIIQNESIIYVSLASFWEISIKFGIGKLDLKSLFPNDLPEICLKYNFKILPISIDEVTTYHQIKTAYHKDPFDRILIWQAIKNNFTLISNDVNMSPYRIEGLKLLW
jgi:PIN domain nuclease of toxin-antitoxin system